MGTAYRRLCRSRIHTVPKIVSCIEFVLIPNKSKSKSTAAAPAVVVVVVVCLKMWIYWDTQKHPFSFEATPRDLHVLPSHLPDRTELGLCLTAMYLT